MKVGVRRRYWDRMLRRHAWLEPHHPASQGWIRGTRVMMGLSARVLAERMGITETAVFKLEKGEMAGTSSIATLCRAAAAMDCEFVYQIRPARSGTLQDLLYRRSKGDGRMVVRLEKALWSTQPIGVGKQQGARRGGRGTENPKHP